MERSPWNISYFFPSWNSGFWGESPFSLSPATAGKAAVLYSLHFYCRSPRTQHNPAQTKETGVENICVRVGVAPRVGPDSFQREPGFPSAPGGCSLGWARSASPRTKRTTTRGKTLRSFICFLGGHDRSGRFGPVLR